MIDLLQGGVYLVDGREIIADGPDAAQAVLQKTGKTVMKEEAARQTIAYGILESHNTSGNMDKLKIRFDKLTSHDITLWGSYRRPGLRGCRDFPCPMY